MVSEGGDGGRVSAAAVALLITPAPRLTLHHDNLTKSLEPLPSPRLHHYHHNVRVSSCVHNVASRVLGRRSSGMAFSFHGASSQAKPFQGLRRSRPPLVSHPRRLNEPRGVPLLHVYLSTKAWEAGGALSCPSSNGTKAVAASSLWPLGSVHDPSG